MQIFRRFIQLLFLAVFIALMIKGKAQYWMAFIFTSILLSAFLGRFYCGWACPINTLIRPFNFLGKKLGIQRPTPSSIKSGTPRIVVFLIFLAGLGYTIYTITQGRKFPLPLIIIPFGLLVALFINPTAWHRYLCPWGTFFSLTGRFSRHGIKTGKCVGCRDCQTVCASNSVTFDQKLAKINPTNCQLCFECADQCKKGALSYGHLRSNKKKVACQS